MNTVARLYLPCRIVLHTYKNLPYVVTQLNRPTITFNSVRTMAQTSIKSFFMVSPPKSAVKLEKNESEDKSNGDTNGFSPPVTNGKEKVSAKRPRLESSDSDAASPIKKQKATPPSDKKKKVKRQRIESSGSESDKSIENINIESKPENIAVKTEPESPKETAKSKTIKVEKTTSPKTYSSPKSKKKVLAQQKNVKNKIDKKTPVKREKSPSPVKQSSPVKVKKESDDKPKKSVENTTSVKDEKDSKSEKGLVPEVEYNPAKPKYHPVDDACWAAGAAVPYLALARTLELIEATSARLKIIDILSNYLRSVLALTPQDLLPSIYMCLNQLAPAYHSLELGIAETYLMKAIGQCTGRTLAQVKAAAAKSGDLGAVAEQARATQRTMFAPPKLTARKVFNTLKEIAHMTGQASVNKKINKIQSLYVACRHSEARYLIRSLEGKLRIGLAEQSVLQALALATATTPPNPDGVDVLDASKGLTPEKFKARVDEHASIIKTTYCECPSYDSMVPVLLQHGVQALPRYCRLTPGVPLKPMLAHPTKGVSEVFDRFENEQFTCEWKYDGERAQIHVPGDDAPDLSKASIFSRNQENNTTKYPDILRRLPSLLKDTVKSCVLDCEAVAYDTETKQILPFQILSTRKRKDASESDIKVQVCVFVFDLLYLNGAALVREPLQKRRELLREHFTEKEGEWQFATSKDCSSMEEVQQFLDESVKGSCEGLMVKALSGDNAKYDIARRSHNWLKLKKDYLEGVGDTIDVVVIGAYSGRGKRAGTFGGFLLACYEPETDEYQSLCKIGTGFSDEDLQTLTATLKEHVIDAPRSYYRYDNAHAADVWVSARCVWEVRCADLSLSPAHRAAIGLVHNDKGISLRFPRFIRVRDDKSPEQATSAQQIAEMYLAQDQVKNTNKNKKDTNFDDFY
ncbi:DNA ligase 1 [Anticarsia gemmatalis]|uniref:DNA ligase 1 n=1 Tax=Anticarsia gemmatalis TaxID=129554 RepID=UPI003F76DD2F